MSKITEIGSSSQFDGILKANTYVIADFYATWCGPCKQIAPIYEQLATSHSAPGKLAFVKIDTDRNSNIAQQHNVTAMPTFLVFKNGTIKDTIRGANPSALRSAVASATTDAGRGSGPSGAAFQSKGRVLGSEGNPGRTTSGAAFPAFNMGGLSDGIMRFLGLYATTLFSFDAYAAAEASPFNVKTNRR
ncbi:thioredoxin [Microthyrium microscopicum]|uniref:Thioredoxin n=1 Tax=Microthyrium microscopicum TaxID=703497 RepID=A0A6A6TVV9_9PEZI|nr:thioredoxin [Microthyrium microscopicum]